jgi:hypothetical protein
MNKTLTRKTRHFDRKLEALRLEAYNFIKQEIIRLCDDMGWEFSTLYLTTITDVRGKEPVEVEENTPIHELMNWYEDNFGIFPDCIYKEGTWTD